MVRSKVFCESPEKLGDKLSQWLSKKKLRHDKIVSMTQSSHAKSPREMNSADLVILTVLYEDA